MAKKTTPKQDNSNQELFIALTEFEKKGISSEYMISQIKKAITTACKATYGGNEDVFIKIEPETNTFEVYLNKEVVEDVVDTDREIHLDEARKISPSVRLNDKIGIKLDPKDFGRIVIQTARNIIRQGIKDQEKGQALAEYQSKLREVITVTIEQIDRTTGNATVKVGNSISVLSKNEQVPGEVITEGEQLKVYVVDVKATGKDPHAVLSRTHPDLVKRLFESEVPEIFDGTVEIKSISREAGSRTKIAVWSRDENVDAVGACIGPKGKRVGTVVDILKGEKIDIVEYNEDPVKFVTAALSPAEVVRVDIEPQIGTEKICKATVPDSQLSLAIGNKGQNVRLAAKLTGWKIDIRPESGFFGENEETDENAPKYIGDGLDDEEEKEPVKESVTEESAEENVTEESAEESVTAEDTAEESAEE